MRPTSLAWPRRVLATIGAWWLLVTFTPLVRWWTSQLANPWYEANGDVLVVLAGDSLNDGVLGAGSYLRALYTVRAIRAHQFEKVIITGGGATPAPAGLIKNFLEGHGIDTSNVTVETASLSTQQNVINITPDLERLKGKRITLLTSDYHIWRAHHVFLKQGFAVTTAPIPDILKRYGQWPDRAGLFFELCRETAKIAWYKWKGWI